MKCEFCREEIAVDALVCPHCRRDTPQGRTKKGASRLKWVLALIGTPVSILALMAYCGSQLPDRSAGDKIAAACERQYPAGTERNACVITLADKTMDDIQADKINQAARDAGVKP